MNTKPIPAIIMMIAGFITCLIAVFNRTELSNFLKILLIVLIGFYIFGCIIKLVLDKNFPNIEEIEEEENENLDTEDEKELQEDTNEEAEKEI